MPEQMNGDLRKEIASLKTALAVAETVLSQAKQHMAIETQHRVSISLQLATITERLATQQKIIWSLLAVLLVEGAGMAAYVIKVLVDGS